MARGVAAGLAASGFVNQTRNRVAVTFILMGVAMASLFSRVPAIRDQMELSNTGIGMLLLCLSASSVVGLPVSGPLTARFGPARVVRGGSLLVGLGLVVIAVAMTGSSIVAAGTGLAAYGFGCAVWDVAMNVEGADVERQLGRTIMPRFHAGFSLGTILGAGLGALLIRLGIPTQEHLGLVAVPLVGGAWWAVRRYAAVMPEDLGAAGVARAWREPRTLLIGLMVLALALTEGVANDWLALALRDGYQLVEWLAVLGFALFVTAMTAGRMIGPALLDRFGRVSVLWGTMAAAFGGVLLVVFAGPGPLVAVGIVLWGLGASLGFPVGMSAAADDPALAPARVSVVSTIGYGAFMAGPPLLGTLADHMSLLKALLVVAVLLLPAALVVPNARQLTP